MRHGLHKENLNFTDITVNKISPYPLSNPCCVFPLKPSVYKDIHFDSSTEGIAQSLQKQ